MTTQCQMPAPPVGASGTKPSYVFFGGIAETPTYALIEDGAITLHDASAVWGKDCLDSEDDLQAYYSTLVFTGRGFTPKALESDAEVVAYVARTRGTVG